MSNSPTKKAAPRAGETAKPRKGQGQPTMPAVEAQADMGAHVPLEETAVRMAHTVLASRMEFGIVVGNDFPDLHFPTQNLCKVAATVRSVLDTGKRGWPEVMGELIESPQHVRNEVMEAASIANNFAPLPPQACEKAVASLRKFHRIKSEQLLSWKLRDAIAAGEGTSEIIAEFASLENEAAGNETLRQQAYALRFNPATQPPPDEVCLTIGEIPIAARGNLTALQGKSKVGKSAVVSAILAGAQRGEFALEGDTLCISWKGKDAGAIIHLDTEQSPADWHGLVSRSVTRAGLDGVSERLVSLPLVLFARSERMEILEEALKFETEAKGGIDLVVIDGIADLCASPNDEAESLEVISLLMAMAHRFHCPIICILHENPGTDQGKTRGHIGSELNRKAFANLRIDKDTETSVSTIYGTDMRKRDIPRDLGFCFAWDDEAGMHTFQGRAAGLKAAQRNREAIEKARAEWEPIFELIASQRENTDVPAITTKEAAEAERETSGKDNPTKPDTMKKRMQKAESLGVLRKIDTLRWTITQAGTAGNQRENGNISRP